MSVSEGWIKALQYQKTVTGYKSIVDDPIYFLHPEGRTSPEKELELTQLFFSQNPVTAACRYPLRRKVLNEIFSSHIEECPKHLEWKKRIDANSASVIFASGYLSNPSSMFGHTFFKLNSRKNGEDRDELNYGVSFAAQTGDERGLFYGLKGLTGFYIGAWSLIPYHLKLKEYGGMEGRDLYELRLNLTESEVDTLIDFFLELEGVKIDYYFMDDNCSRALLVALEAARPHIELTDKISFGVQPLDTLKAIDASGMILDEKYKPSGKSIFNHLKKDSKIAEQFRVSKAIHNKNYEILISAEELDLALEYFQLEELSNPQGVDRELIFNLKKRRSRLGSYIKPPPPPPESILKGHGSSLIGVRKVHDSREQTYLHYRGGFHSLDQGTQGYLSGAEILYLDLHLKFENSAPQLELVKWLKVLSLNPIDLFYFPFSWGLELMSFDDLKQSQANLYAGLTIGVDKFKLATLAKLSVAKSIEINPLLLVQWDLWSHWSGSLEIEQTSTGFKKKSGMNFYNPGSAFSLFLGQLNERQLNQSQVEISYTY